MQFSDSTAHEPQNLQFTLEIQGFKPTDFAVIRFDYHETYNEPFELDLVVASQTVRDVDFNQLLDVRGRLKIWDDDKLQRTISGIVTFAEQGEYGNHFTFYLFA